MGAQCAGPTSSSLLGSVRSLLLVWIALRALETELPVDLHTLLSCHGIPIPGSRQACEEPWGCPSVH